MPVKEDKKRYWLWLLCLRLKAVEKEKLNKPEEEELILRAGIWKTLEGVLSRA